MLDLNASVGCIKKWNACISKFYFLMILVILVSVNKCLLNMIWIEIYGAWLVQYNYLSNLNTQEDEELRLLMIPWNPKRSELDTSDSFIFSSWGLECLEYSDNFSCCLNIMFYLFLSWISGWSEETLLICCTTSTIEEYSLHWSQIQEGIILFNLSSLSMYLFNPSISVVCLMVDVLVCAYRFY